MCFAYMLRMSNYSCSYMGIFFINNYKDPGSLLNNQDPMESKVFFFRGSETLLMVQKSGNHLGWSPNPFNSGINYHLNW